jgi:hypothetical protein
MNLEETMTSVICRLCTHLKGRGGVKGSIRDIQHSLPWYPFVASYYDSIDHTTLLSQLEEIVTPLPTIEVVSHYLTTPDRSFRCRNGGWWIDLSSPWCVVPEAA